MIPAAVRENMDSSISIARRRHSVMRCPRRSITVRRYPRPNDGAEPRRREKTRMSCMYEYNQNPDGKGGFVLGQITSIKSVVGGCAAGSVWEDDQSGRVHLASRTAESLGSVWRKVPARPRLPAARPRWAGGRTHA